MRITDRKGLVALLSSVNEGNRTYYRRYGQWHSPHVKVFWVEVNEPFAQEALTAVGAQLLDRGLYEWQVREKPDEEPRRLWIDASDSRIWQIYTLEDSTRTKTILSDHLLGLHGVDGLWFPEKYMERTVKTHNFDDRGIGIKYKDILSEEKFPSDFSAKLWVGKRSSGRHRDIVDFVRQQSSLSSIRFGRNVSSDGSGMTGQLYEMFYDGHLTVNICDDSEEMFGLLAEIRGTYKAEIEELEAARKRHPTIIEVDFSDEVKPEQLDRVVRPGTRKLRLWLHPYAKEDGMTRYNGVDLHTGDFIHLDLGEDYSYISAEKGACMNVAPRYGTLAARFLSAKATITHDGVELFA